MRTRVKVCGITRPEDGVEAARCGADAVGLVFYAGSPRAVDIDGARAIIEVLPPFVTTVALFVDPSTQTVAEVLKALPIDLIQFHGDEAPSFCNQFERPYIKAVRMRDGIDLDEVARRYGSARGLLLDTYRPGIAGGTGETFDWDQAPREFHMPIVLAGGLTPENVAAAVRQVKPYGVDVSGGVEADKGIKDAGKIAAFMRGVNSVEID